MSRSDLDLPSFIPRDILLESFTYPFFDSSFSVDPLGLARLFLDKEGAATKRGLRGLYVHIPFCDSLCGFCPFVKSVGTQERIASYLDALCLEICLLAETPLARSWEFDAVYIGGGTPSVLTPIQIERLINTIKSTLRLTSDVEFTIEVEPKSASDQFCDAAALAGANRISFGVQTLHPEFREMMNLTASLDQIYELARISRKYFQVSNLDMIVGYPGQTEEQVVTDMAGALELDVGNISVFPLDYLATLPKLLDKIRHGELPPPPPSTQRWEMFHRARSKLGEVYSAQNMYFFAEPGMPGCKYMFNIVYGGYFDEYIGLGASAYSSIRGLAYCNTQSEVDYIRRVTQARELPISDASPGHAYEKSYVYFGKRMRADLGEAIELGISDFIGPKFNALVQAGLVSQDGDDFTLTPRGARFYAQIMVGFLSDGQRRIYDRVCARMRDQLNWTFDGASGPECASTRILAARNTMLHNV
ncbi:coproporphyrinogen-III oxidase family protein [Synechococcus sp. EJ6-Ellesmere]|uniref:coproporphyrinogen-III oxidase family protein n=1 Tax=Synechococcus sp. EJ6-Ellesmere TaxID=2823734 RepID=UPI0020CD34AD|nr:coproporphyrinogen-III oxidase family protein [Synechococcus sp. EJ6-Ellesmere]MCP9823847.1 radical SAM protein [Synechococcus sp. EJ6-Ellesmere]